MQKYQDAILKPDGAIVVGASVLVTAVGSTTPSTIYSDNGITTASNPLTTDSTGSFAFYAADGRYSLTVSGAGFTTITKTDILLEDPADATALNGTSLTVSGNTILGDTYTDTLNVGNGGLIKDASGNVGIGVTPQAWSGLTAINIREGTSLGSDGSNYFLQNNAYYNGTNWKYVNSGIAVSQYLSSGGSHQWFTAPSGTVGNNVSFTEQMRLDASGNLGIGVTPSAWSSGKAIEATVLGNAIWSQSGANAITQNLYFNSGYKYANTAAASMYFQNGGVHTWYTVASGTAGNAASLTASLAVGKGTSLALEGATSAAGVGIAFPATQVPSTDPNTMDDYEEGNWTPSFTSLTVVNGTGGATYSGTYTKWGRVVKWKAVITVTGTCTTAATLGTTLITNLPFVVANTGYEVCYAKSSLNVADGGIGYVQANTTNVSVPTWAATNGLFTITGTYEV